MDSKKPDAASRKTAQKKKDSLQKKGSFGRLRKQVRLCRKKFASMTRKREQNDVYYKAFMERLRAREDRIMEQAAASLHETYRDYAGEGYGKTSMYGVLEPQLQEADAWLALLASYAAGLEYLLRDSKEPALLRALLGFPEPETPPYRKAPKYDMKRILNIHGETGEDCPRKTGLL